MVRGSTAALVAAVAAAGGLIAAAGWRTLAPVGEVVVAPVVVRGEALWSASAGVRVSAAGSSGAERAAVGEGEVGSGGGPSRFAGRGGAEEGGGAGVVVQAPGWLEADPYFVAATALTEGVIEEILVLEGERVEAGEVVARLVREDAELLLARAEAEAARARASAAVAAARVEAAETEWSEPVERERAVASARASLAETEAELAQLPSLIDAERATLRRLEEESERARVGFEAGGVNEIEKIIAEQSAAAQRASLGALERERGILEARAERLRAEVRAAERHAELRVEERLALAAARAGLDRARAELADHEAHVAQAELRLERTSVRTPIGGLVQRRLKSPGDKVMLGSDDLRSAQVALVFDPSELQVRVDVPLADASRVFVGQRCEVIAEVLPERSFAGEVSRITHEADLQKNTLEVKVSIDDPPTVFKPEMLARVRFLEAGGASDGGSAGGSVGGAGTGEGAGGVRVPARFVERSGAGAAVWVVRDRRGDRGTLHRVRVRVEEESGGWAAVSGGLLPTDLAARSRAGFGALSEGDRVRMVSGGSAEGDF